MYNHKTVHGIRRGAHGTKVVKMHTVGKDNVEDIIGPNIQVSWVKEGARLSQLLLAAGVNDFGGTLMRMRQYLIQQKCTAWPADETKRSPLLQLIRAAGTSTHTALYEHSDSEGICR